MDVIGLGRRSGAIGERARIIAVDLLSPADCAAKLGGLSNITHIVFAAWAPRDSRAAEVAPNLDMLRHLMEAVAPIAPGLAHVTLLQGGKAYGSHLGGFQIHLARLRICRHGDSQSEDGEDDLWQVGAHGSLDD